jgi:hypothetical protein
MVSRKTGRIIFGQRLAAVRTVMWRGFTLAEGWRWVREAMSLVDEGTPLRTLAQLEHSEAEGARRLGDFKGALDAAERALFGIGRLAMWLKSLRLKVSPVECFRFSQGLRRPHRCCVKLWRLRIQLVIAAGVNRTPYRGDIPSAEACIGDKHAPWFGRLTEPFHDHRRSEAPQKLACDDS